MFCRGARCGVDGMGGGGVAGVLGSMGGAQRVQLRAVFYKAAVYLRVEARDGSDFEAALLDELRQLGREHARAGLLAIGEGGLELVVRALIQ